MGITTVVDTEGGNNRLSDAKGAHDRLFIFKGTRNRLLDLINLYEPKD